MWTPKRIVLLVLGFALFFTGYFTYSFVLGGIDGLPPLPVDYLICRDGEGGLPQRPAPKVEEKLRQAFNVNGVDCPEVKWLFKLEMQRNNMVLAFETFDFDKKGRLVLTPFSVAMFGKPKNDGRDVEINTIRSQIAYLTFDKPIGPSINPNEMTGRKILEAELSGDITVINNRRNAHRDDDLELFIKTGPLYFNESKRLIWTFDDIHLTDWSSKPKPHQVWGKGMEVELLAEKPAQPAPNQKPQQETITGVKSVTLQSNVDMHLFTDGSNNFLGSPNDKSGGAKAKPLAKGEVEAGPMNVNVAKDVPAKGKTPSEKADLHITTPGRFQYVFYKDYEMAHFEVTPGGQAAPLDRGGRVVHVDREKQGQHDQLYCLTLDLKLIRKDGKQTADKSKPHNPEKNPKPASGEPHDVEQNISIEWVHAVDPNNNMTLISDTEKLSVVDFCDLLHEATTKLTVLKSKSRLTADKGIEHNKLLARELHIQEMPIPNSDKSYQTTTALGPGQIDLGNKETQKHLQHAFWNDTLVSTKDERTLTAKGEMQDMLILTGAARFVDNERGQELQAETLKVWLLGTTDKPAKSTVEKATPAKSSSVGDANVKVDHIEAIKNVTATSRELNIHDTARLVVWFKDAPPSALPPPLEVDGRARGALPPVDRPPPPPASINAPKPLPPGAAALPEQQVNKPLIVNTNPPPPPAVKPPPTKPEEPARPIDLSARSVEAWVLREEIPNKETKNTLEKLWTEGNVHVHQPPAKPDEQPVDILGDTLNMIYHPDGNFLVVTGNEQNHAQLQMDKILVIGPEVNIDQAQNKAWVVGAGVMRIDSTTTLDGKPRDKSVPLEIMWHKSMFFQGRYAEFNNGIQATQEQARMACNRLQVYFDKPISLKEGNKNEKSPQVQKLLCDQNTRVEDITYEGDKLVKYQRLEAPVATMEALEVPEGEVRKENQTSPGNEVRASGPGVLRLVQRGGTDPLAPPPDPKQKPPAPKPAAKPAADDPLKLTLVDFGGTMYANSKTNFASFRKNVRVLNMPVEDPMMDLDIDVILAKLPEGAMYMSCHNLEVYTRQEKGKNYQEMYARDQAVVQSKDFWGRSASIHFDESKDQVIFDGGPGGKAELWKSKQAGANPQHIKGDKIIYNRRTGEFHGDKLESLEAD